MTLASPPKYGSREWLRRLPAGCRPVGAYHGLVVVRCGSVPPGAWPAGPFALCVGGTAEAPTLISLQPEQAEEVVWVTGPGGSSTGSSRAWDSRMGDWMSVGAEKDNGAGATPWIFGGLLLAAAFGVAAMEKKMTGAR